MRSPTNLPPVRVPNPMIRGLSVDSDGSDCNEMSREYLRDFEEVPSKAARLLGIGSSSPSSPRSPSRSTRPATNDQEGLPFLTTSSFAQDKDYRAIYRSTSGGQTPVQAGQNSPSLSSSRSTPRSFFRKSERPGSSSSTGASFSTSQLSPESERSSMDWKTSTRTPSLCPSGTSGSESGHEREEGSRRPSTLVSLALSNSGALVQEKEEMERAFSSPPDRPAFLEFQQAIRPKLFSRSRSSTVASTSSSCDTGRKQEKKVKVIFNEGIFHSRSRSTSISSTRHQQHVVKPEEISQKPSSIVASYLQDTDFTLPPLSAPPTFEEHKIGTSTNTEDEQEEMVPYDEPTTSAGRLRRSFIGKVPRNTAGDTMLGKEDLRTSMAEDRYPRHSHSSLNSSRGCEVGRSSLEEISRSSRPGFDRRSSDSTGSSFEPPSQARRSRRPKTAKGLIENTSSSNHRPTWRGEGESASADLYSSRATGSSQPKEQISTSTATPSPLNRPFFIRRGTTTIPDSASRAPKPPHKSNQRPKTSSGELSTNFREGSSRFTSITRDLQGLSLRERSGSETSWGYMSTAGGGDSHFSVNEASEAPFFNKGPFSTHLHEHEDFPGQEIEEARGTVVEKTEGRRSSGFNRLKLKGSFSKFF